MCGTCRGVRAGHPKGWSAHLHLMAEATVTEPVDAFLGTYAKDPNAWYALGATEHLDLFAGAVDRMQTAEARVGELEALLAQAREAARSLLALVTPTT